MTLVVPRRDVDLAGRPGIDTKPTTTPPADELARIGSRLVASARKQAVRRAEQARPGVEKAAREAFQYAREHEDEIKVAVAKVLRTRAPIPLRLAIDVVARRSEQRLAETKAPGRCGACGQQGSASARFCTNCGAALS